MFRPRTVARRAAEFTASGKESQGKRTKTDTLLLPVQCAPALRS